MTIKTINYLISLNHNIIKNLAKDNFCNKLKYIDNDQNKEFIIDSMFSPKETNDSSILVDVHGSAKDLTNLVKQLLIKYSIDIAVLYLI